MRNPLAFRPKIEVALDDNIVASSPNQNDSNLNLKTSTEPSSIAEKDKRHFKGCNCKKSNCQKKYCECFQSGVNCSDLCKCEECKNNETCKPCTFEQMFKVHKEERKVQPLLESNKHQFIT